MKQFALLAISLWLASCGSSNSTSFPGVWDGTLTLASGNTCPFTPAPAVTSVFPLTITEDAAPTLTIVAGDGSTATGTQGDDTSFLATAPVFGNYGSTAPYACNSTAQLQFYSASGSSSNVALTFTVINCTAPGVAATTNCSFSYAGTASQQ